MTDLHTGVVEKRSFNGIFTFSPPSATSPTTISPHKYSTSQISTTNNNNNISPPAVALAADSIGTGGGGGSAAAAAANGKQKLQQQQQQQFLVAPRPLRRCRSASPVPQRLLYTNNNNGSNGTAISNNNNNNQQQQQQCSPHPLLAASNGLIYHHQLLSGEQQALIRKSWLKISRAAFGNAVYEIMLERCPAIGRMFDADPTAIGRHERYFAELAQWTVDGMGEPERLLGQWLEMVGRGHAQFRVKRAHWDYLGEALTEAICQSATITGRQRRDTVHAWRILLSFVADRLGNICSPGGVAAPECFNRIYLLQLVSDGPNQQQQQQQHHHQGGGSEKSTPL